MALLPPVDKAIGAEEYSTKMITILCGYSAGGSTDRQIRLLVPYLQKHLGKSIMIENLTGAQGVLAIKSAVGLHKEGFDESYYLSLSSL